MSRGYKRASRNLFAPPPLPLPFTFVQPVAEPVEDAALFAGGNQAYGSTLHRRAVVDVVFKNEDLQTGERGEE